MAAKLLQSFPTVPQGAPIQSRHPCLLPMSPAEDSASVAALGPRGPPRSPPLQLLALQLRDLPLLSLGVLLLLLFPLLLLRLLVGLAQGQSHL